MHLTSFPHPWPVKHLGITASLLGFNTWPAALGLSTVSSVFCVLHNSLTENSRTSMSRMFPRSYCLRDIVSFNMCLPVRVCVCSSDKWIISKQNKTKKCNAPIRIFVCWLASLLWSYVDKMLFLSRTWSTKCQECLKVESFHAKPDLWRLSIYLPINLSIYLFGMNACLNFCSLLMSFMFWLTRFQFDNDSNLPRKNIHCNTLATRHTSPCWISRPRLHKADRKKYACMCACMLCWESTEDLKLKSMQHVRMTPVK